MDIIQFYQAQILPALDKKLVFTDLNLNDKGDHYSLDCPNCKKHEAYIYKNSDMLICNRKTNCGYFVSIPTYLNGGSQPRGRNFIEIIKKLCTLSGLEFIPSIIDHDELNAQSPEEFRQKVFQEFVNLTKQALYDEVGTHARKYVNSRGWDDITLRQYEFGYYPSAQWISENLQKNGYLISTLKDLGIYRSDWDNRIIYPWRDQNKKIVNFWARALVQTEDQKKYLLMSSDKGATKAIPFGFDKVDSDNIIAVEGFFDALKLISYGHRNIIALSGTSITQDQSRFLKHAKVKSITLMFDNDEAGRQAISREIEKFASSDFQIFVIPNHYLLKAKDPDEFCQIYGYQALHEILKGRLHAYRYKARQIVQQNNNNQKMSDHGLMTTLDQAFTFAEKITNPVRKFELQFFWNEISRLTGCTQEMLDEHQKALLSKKNNEQQRASYQQFYKDIAYALKSNDYEAIETTITKAAERITIQNTPAVSQLVKVNQLIKEHENSLEQHRGKDFIGLCQKSIEPLDTYLSGLRKLIVLAAAPNVGKTALTIQNALDILLHNANACLLYVSLEMSREEILARMRCYLARMTWTTLFFGSDKKALSGSHFTPEEHIRLKESHELLTKLGDRMCILDSSSCNTITADIILAHLEALKVNTECSRSVIVIDYLQVWPIPEELERRLRSDMEIDKWRIGQMKKLKDSINQDPVIVISEARKPTTSQVKDWAGDISDVMGAARLTYTPDVVLLLNPLSDTELNDEWNKRMNYHFSDDKHENGAAIRGFFEHKGYALNRLKITKGRDGMRRGEILLRFYFQENRFELFDWAQEVARLTVRTETI